MIKMIYVLVFKSIIYLGLKFFLMLILCIWINVILNKIVGKVVDLS